MDMRGVVRQGKRRSLTRRLLLAGSVVGAASVGLATAIGCGTKGKAGPTSGQPACGTPVYGGSYNWYITGNPTGLDTHTNARYWTQDAIGGVQSRLLQFRTGSDPQVFYERVAEPDLALSLESPDAVTWTAKLRPDAKFHNSPPVNAHAVEAEDIKASFVRALTEPKNANREALGMIDETKIQTPAPDTVVFQLRYAYAPFTKTLASPTYSWIFPREVLGAGYDPDKQVIGSGPFLFDSYTPDVALSYKKNPDWFMKGRPYVDSARIAIIPSVPQQLAQFTGGNLDEVSVEQTDLETMKQNRPKATLLKLSPPSAAGFVFGQMGDPASVWADIRVRQAVSMAIDRDALAKINAPLGGEKQMIVGVSFGKWALRPENLPADTARWYKYDPAEVKKLLAAAGRADFPFRFIYTNNGYGDRFNRSAEAINSMLNAAGFKTNLVTIDYAKDYVGGGKGIRYGSAPNDAIVYGITAGYEEVDEILFNYFHSTSKLNNTHLKDPDVDAMIAKERALVKEDERVKAVLDVQKYLGDKLYLVAGMPDPYGYTMVQPWVQNHHYTSDYGIATEGFSQAWITK